jgi:hypothetical protein
MPRIKTLSHPPNLCVFYQIMSALVSCRIRSTNDGEERIYGFGSGIIRATTKRPAVHRA